MKFISSGHCATKGPNYDPGAPGVNGRFEAFETIKVRNAVIAAIKARNVKDIIQDADGESLSQYLTRIKTGTGSVVVEFHFNASASKEATGVESIVQVDADKMDIACAKEFSRVTSQILGIPLRGNNGVKSEIESQHRRLGIMRESGIVVLVEICFISNPTDMASFDSNFNVLCTAYANIIERFDNLIE